MEANISVKTPNDEFNFDNIKQYFVCVESEKSKFETVCELYKTQDIERAVIYCNSGKKADSLSKLMEDNGFIVKSLVSP
jgi:superfamily II DNA/RNA helicase